MSLPIPPDAVAAQRRSSDPAASVWVSANAGAGKTYVLAERVVRLLLSGVPPRAILCLTFTTAAAAEMAGRVFTRLGRLATLGEDALFAEVAALAPGADRAAAAARARTLFAETLETPGGLKVQTLHAFAASLLRRFPLEANVPGGAEALDEATADEMMDRAIADTLAEAVREPDGEIARAIAALVPHVTDVTISDAVKAALATGETLAAWAWRRPTEALRRADLAHALALGDAPPPSLWSVDRCREIVAAAQAAGQSADAAKALAEALECGEPALRDAAFRRVVLKADGAPRKAPFAKAILKALPGLDEEIAAEQDRQLALDDHGRTERCIEATLALIALAAPAERRFAAETRRRGLVGYADQIRLARQLVNTEAAAAWVRFKLDEGIDHVMVDEAQDTAPDQWGLVSALTGEFFAGQGAREVERTLFVVGDEKQSIYSFQGAAPKLFDEKRREYEGAARDAGLAFRAVSLAHSFRSAPQILAAVDAVFAAEPQRSDVGTEAEVSHQAIVPHPGGVDVWPLVGDTPSERPDDWDAPFDATPGDAGPVKLVRAIADQIEAWRKVGPDGGAPIRPGDVLVLARKREPLATLMNRELKARGIAAAGTDRLVVTEHIAVKDMLALCRTLVSRDDLSLAAALRSPLFNVSEDALFALAHGRTGSLGAALKADPAHRDAAEALVRWGRLARSARPFELLVTVLIAEGRRADFAARMGAEAEDALDAFLDIALQLERRGATTMEAFLSRITRAKTELKRAPPPGLDAVRVMTVHGAKGLEAKVVFLADMGAKPGGGRAPPAVLPFAEDGELGRLLAFSPRKEYRAAPVQAVLDAREAAERAEHNRLLYVGMTRAERHLVICGAYRKNPPTQPMWHKTVMDALGPCGQTASFPLGEGLSWRTPAVAGPPWPSSEPTAAPPHEAPGWLFAPARLAPAPERLTPSEGAAHGVSPPSGRILSAAAHGTMVHELLERDGLSREEMAARVTLRHPGLAADAVAAILDEVAGTLALPELAAPIVRREVGLLGDLTLRDGSVRRVTARLDRLLICERAVTVVDYKTDRTVPTGPSDVPQHYLGQLALYRALAQGLADGRTVEAAIVWTAMPSFMRLTAHLPPAAVAPPQASA